MRKKKISNIVLFLSGIMLSLLGGCSKDTETDPSETGGKLVPIQIIMQGYQDLVDGDAASRSVSGKTEIEVVRQNLNIPGYENYEMVTTVEKTPIKEVQTRANMDDHSVFNMYVFDSAGALAGNWQYRVIGTIATLIGGTTATGPILKEGTYKFVCTTYNSEKNYEGLLNIPVNNSEDFATCHFVQKISETANSVSIHFVRQISQFKVSATATGFTDNNVSIGSVSVTNLYSDGNITLGNSSTSSTSIVGNGSTTLTFAGNVANKIIPVLRSKDITLNDIVIEGSHKGDKKITIATNFEKGRNYNINVSFEKKNGFLVGGVEWASGGMQYANGVYSISKNQGQITGVNGSVWNAVTNPDYFSFYTLTPTATSLNNGDPCSKVPPLGTWRLPTKTDFEAIMRMPYIEGKNSNGIYGYFFGVTKVPSATEESNTLFFPIAGYRYPADGKIYGVKDGGGYYWSSTSYDATQAYYLFIHPDFGPSMKIANRNTGLTIRCVKN